MRTLEELHERDDTDLPLHHYRDILLPEPAARQAMRRTGERITAYTDGHSHYPATRYVISEIDWHVLPDSHPLHDDAPRRQHEVNEREHIRRYARTRGRILHSLLEGHANPDIYSDTLDDISVQLDALDTDGEYKDAYQAVASWPGSPKTDPSHTPHDHRDALRNSAEMEAGDMELRWHEWRNQHDIEVVSREHIYTHSPDSMRFGRGHGGQADAIINVPRDSTLDVPAGLYSPDIKSGLKLSHADRMQAEAHRRAFSSWIGEEVGGMLIHPTPDDIDIQTHHSDSWPSEALWDTFCQKISYLYEETLLDVVMTLAEE